ncbi:helix-turn-helix transcriptional regulator [Runella slithyformis]|uniref:Helix-turn-helix domain protein n=1 Tax=Runella slithyformis (strain ATCC 29530 / DSM 19594 / LMG 11500 / NCIMB 11436 / LSU 4) TaxID=761193 RepID=A0A7U4E6K8_RUNSL|nr:helix-turn-helix transcriptional regulator [Runella slithyformis]AEI49434.1 helix-turn-helix domain protein [Runella slithyformis DSM 19594]
MTFGTFLLNLRHEHRLSQKDVAAAVNVAQSTYCDWESDKRLPKTSHIQPLARFYNLKEDNILQKMCGKDAATETELDRLKLENEHLRQRDVQQEETIRALENTIKKLSPPHSSNGETNENTGGVIR